MTKHRPIPFEHYRYAHLPDGQSIRLMVLDPGFGPLSCTLHARRIQDASLNYDALSYVWGKCDDRHLHDLRCDGQVLRIGSNLVSALKHIRHPTQPRQLWVDAISINQVDKDERAEQVKLMGDIYANARRVLVWIGKDGRNEADDCFTLIQNTVRYVARLLEIHKDLNSVPKLRRGSICTDTTRWDKVRRLMEAEWFSRLWVLQEIGLARAATIFYGNVSMEWSYLVELMLIVASRSDIRASTGNIKSGPIWDAFEDIWRSFGNSPTWRTEQPVTKALDEAMGSTSSIVHILADARVYNTTDQLDRVYAFLSHPKAQIGARKAPLIDVDYRLSVDEAYLETASRLLQEERHAWTVLSTVDHAVASPSLYGMRPSFVPRWDEGWRAYWLGYPEMWYRAGGWRSGAFRTRVQHTASGSSLQMKGILFDTVEWTSAAFDWDTLDLNSQQQSQVLLSLWEQIERRRSCSMYGSTRQYREHAYSLTLAAGRAADEGPAEDDRDWHQSVYDQYKLDLSGQRSSFEHVTTGDSELRAAALTHEQERASARSLDAMTYITNQRRALHNRRFFQTSKGYYGIGHRELEFGDVCVVFRGANVPFLLRPVDLTAPDQQHWQDVCPDLSVQSEHVYRLVGECYLQGIMRGQVIEMLDGPNLDELEEVEMLII